MLFSQLNEADTDFMVGQNNHDARIEGRNSITDKGTSLDNARNPAQANYLQEDMHTLEENIVSKVRNEVDIVMTLVETRVQDAVLTAIQNLVMPRVELEPDHRDFTGIIEGLQMTASSRTNSHTDLNRIDETRGYSIVEAGDWLDNERNTDRQTHTHHSSVVSFSKLLFEVFIASLRSWKQYLSQPIDSSNVL